MLSSTWALLRFMTWGTAMTHTTVPKTRRNRRRAAILFLAAVLVIGALAHWRQDIAQLLDSGTPLFIAGLLLVIPYLVLFVLLSRHAVRARLDDDETLLAQVRALKVLRWAGVGLTVVLAIGMAQPAFAGEWDPYWIDAMQQGGSEYLTRAIVMVVHAVMISGMIAGATAFLFLWVLGVVEVILCALTLGTPAPSWDARKEEPLPDDVIVKVMGARIHGALAMVRPDWVADGSDSDRLQAVTELAQSVGTFHLTCGLILFAAWIAWSLLEVVIEVVTW